MLLKDIRDTIYYIAGRRSSMNFNDYDEERKKIEEIINKLDKFTLEQCISYTDMEILDINKKIRRLELARTILRATNTMFKKNLISRQATLESSH